MMKGFSETAGRSPYGERGLKFMESALYNTTLAGRSPYGERGLKSEIADCGYVYEVALLTESVD